MMTGLACPSAVAHVDVEQIGKPRLISCYDKPANDWESQALPLGNGFMGAMIFGGVEREKIQINEHSLWSGGPGANANYNGGHGRATKEINRANLQAARQMLQDNMILFSKSNTAYIHPVTGRVIANNYPGMSQQLIRHIEALKGDKTNYGSYQSLGNILIDEMTHVQSLPLDITSNALTQNPDEGIQRMLDGNVNTKWYSSAGLPWGTSHPFPIWIQTEYFKEIPVDYYQISSANDMPERDPRSWNLYGSNNGKDFTLIDTQTDVIFSNRFELKKFKLDSQVNYKYYRLEILDNYGRSPSHGCQVSRFDYGLEESAIAKENYSEYKRTLDIDNAIATMEYTLDGINYYRKYFINYPSNVMVMEFTADQLGKISKRISIDTPQPNMTIVAEEDTITMTGWPSDHNKNGLQVAQQIKIISNGGTVKVVGESIEVENANSMIILMTAGTNYQQSMDDNFNYFNEKNPLQEVKQRITTATSKGYSFLLEEHIDDYKSLYDRLILDLGSRDFPDKTTDRLIAEYGSFNTKDENLYLETLYYQFGRYLLIASSREGSLPANLQGVWADGLRPPWDADYHTNINLQMNYWLAEQTNLSECHLPLIDFINSLVPRGRLTAEKYFVTENGGSVRGWTTFHENNIWGNTAPAVSSAFYFPVGAAWLVQHIWEVYAFNLDEEFLRENYNTMLEAALFWVDNLVTDQRDGTLVSSPSWSPEHGPFSLGCTQDQAIIWDVFNNTIKASEVLGKDSLEIQEIRNALAKLSPPSIGLAGQFQEWKDEVTIDITGDGAHRHVNHLYGLHPGNQFVAGRSDMENEILESMKVTLNTRGDGGTGWSKAWKINFWARLRDGDRAHKLVQEIIKGSTLPNLFDTHPPFQIDGNFGAVAGMTEILLQSQGELIELLPALPKIWSTGRIYGLKARGNVEIDLEWSNSVIQTAILKPKTSLALKVRADGASITNVQDSNGHNIRFKELDKNTIELEVTADETYKITFQ